MSVFMLRGSTGRQDRARGLVAAKAARLAFASMALNSAAVATVATTLHRSVAIVLWWTSFIIVAGWSAAVWWNRPVGGQGTGERSVRLCVSTHCLLAAGLVAWLGIIGHRSALPQVAWFALAQLLVNAAVGALIFSRDRAMAVFWIVVHIAAVEFTLIATPLPFRAALAPQALVYGAVIAIATWALSPHGSALAAQPAPGERLVDRRGEPVGAGDDTLASELRHALEHGEFVLHYQPIVEVAEWRLHCFEALIRWSHPERGMIGPDHFISAVDKAGLSVSLGTWVLEQACAEAAGWPPGIGVAVNVSAAQIQDPMFPGIVERVVRCSGIDATRLAIEVVEHDLISDRGAAALTLHQLRRLGVEIALDDFLVDYSALGAADQLPATLVKIDRSFTEPLNTRQAAPLAELVVAVAGRLGLSVVAEGIETVDGARSATLLGAGFLQGFHIGRPMAPTALSDFISSWQQNTGRVAATSHTTESGVA